jgi:pimeloyl-ACP methyl ester carboxylesterase
MTTITQHDVDANGLRLHYTECGSGEPVLLLHGWPTSSFLWRNVMPPIAAAGARAIALDLPGFGDSDKPLDVRYGFRFFNKVLDGFLDALSISAVSLVVHDLSGPVGLYWAAHNKARVRKLAILDTLLYPDLHWSVVAFIAACRVPGLRALLTSPRGLEMVMRMGVKEGLSDEVIATYLAPFRSKEARRALAKTAYGLSPKGIAEVVRFIPTLDVPVRIIYGDKDVLPGVAKTMHRLAREVPHAQLSALAGSGHFPQEDRPAELGRMLGDFFVARSANLAS